MSCFYVPLVGDLVFINQKNQLAEVIKVAMDSDYSLVTLVHTRYWYKNKLYIPVIATSCMFRPHEITLIEKGAFK